MQYLDFDMPDIESQSLNDCINFLDGSNGDAGYDDHDDDDHDELIMTMMVMTMMVMMVAKQVWQGWELITSLQRTPLETWLEL